MGTEDLIRHLAHIGIAVKDTEAALKIFTGVLGGSVIEKKSVPEMNLEITLISLGGINIELLQPTGEGPVSSFLEKRGPGVHHLAFEVDDIEEALRKAREAGLRLIDSTPRRGATAGRIAFLHPSSTANVLIELCEH